MKDEHIGAVHQFQYSLPSICRIRTMVYEDQTPVMLSPFNSVEFSYHMKITTEVQELPEPNRVVILREEKPLLNKSNLMEDRCAIPTRT
jgi:hypothetical protein